MLKILSFPVGQDGCSGYRVRKPLEGLQLYTESDCHIIDKNKDDMNKVVNLFPLANAIWMRPGAEKGRRDILEIFKKENVDMSRVKWIMDIDDNLELVSPYSEFYRHNGMEEFTYNGKKIWEDGKNGFNLEENRARVASQIQGLRDSDMVVTTTPKLAEYVRQFNDTVYVNDNTIDFNQWWKIDHKPNKRLKVLWAGSPSHYQDFYTIKDAIQRLLKEYDFELLMVGSNYPGIFGDHRDRITTLPWVVFKAHSYRLMSLCADIAIIPLEDNEFNQYKSAIKFYEVSAMGVPAVVSNVTPYKEVAKHNNALLYKTDKGFYKQMKKLLESESLRKEIGTKAYNWVYKNKNLETESKKLAERIEKLCQTTTSQSK